MAKFTNKIKRLIIACNYLTFKKVVILHKIVFSYILSVFGVVGLKPKYPHFISVETTNYCNLHCPECPVGLKQYQNKSSCFDYNLFVKLINELKTNIFHVILYFQGEPFLHNNLAELIKYAHKSKLYTSTSTNGQFLRGNMAREIVLSGLDKLIISVDGSTQEVYQSYRVGGNLQKALDGIKELVYWKKMLKSATPLLEIQFIVLKTNESQLDEMRKLARALDVDRLAFKTAQLYNFESGNELMTSKSKYSRYKKNKQGKLEIKAKQLNRCWRLWSGAVVNVHGEVLPCCFDKGSEHSFGNVQNNLFSACWSNKKASDFRAKILHNRKQFEMCRNCTAK